MSASQEKPTISVIVPSYNKPEYLPECLGSIKAQTFRDWECIVVSDGSPRVDEIRAAVAATGDSRFRLVEHVENRGLAAARNTGIRDARGEFVICVDEDDRIREDSLEVLIGLATGTGASIVCPQGRFFGGSDRRRGCHKPSLNEILVTQPLLPAGSLIRKDVFSIVGLYDEHPIIRMGREDHEWWIRVVSLQIPFYVSADELYFVRRARSAEELEQSLDFSACANESRIYEYIVRKHQEVYDKYPKEHRAVLRNARVREARYHALHGAKWRAMKCLWSVLWISRNYSDFRAAVRDTITWLLGEKFAKLALFWRGRFKSQTTPGHAPGIEGWAGPRMPWKRGR